MEKTTALRYRGQVQMKGEMGLRAVSRARSHPVLPVDVMSFTALADRETPRQRSLETCSNAREAQGP